MTDKLVQEILIDVSEDEAPKPFEIILAQLARLKKGEYIRMLHRKQPLPLLQMLDENGFSFRMFSGTQTPWEIIIWSKQDLLTHEFCNASFSA
ncbi:MAG: DUF2249 domain-containing protein [Proteobacteria bacterium]|nr:DUF2249 domain-containing protein [Pseudomonadota bacterium]